MSVEFDIVKTNFVKLSNDLRNHLLLSFVVAITSHARRYYKGRPKDEIECDKLSSINEITHSVIGYIIQSKLDCISASPKCLWDTIIQKAEWSGIDGDLLMIMRKLIENEIR
jgi:hypothetical protein